MANVDERDAAYDLINDISGVLIGDKGYICPELKEDCQSLGILVVPRLVCNRACKECERERRKK